MNQTSSISDYKYKSKSAQAFRTISEASIELDLPQHVLRFWESKFNQIKPLKRGGNRRYYRPEDLDILRKIRSLLYDDGYTIKGVQKLFKENNFRTGKSKDRKYSIPPKKIERNIKEDVLHEIINELEDMQNILNECPKKI